MNVNHNHLEKYEMIARARNFKEQMDEIEYFVLNKDVDELEKLGSNY